MSYAPVTFMGNKVIVMETTPPNVVIMSPLVYDEYCKFIGEYKSKGFTLVSPVYNLDQELW